MTRKHKKHNVISIKTSKFMASHVEPQVLAGNRIFSGTVLNVIEINFHNLFSSSGCKKCLLRNFLTRF